MSPRRLGLILILAGISFASILPSVVAAHNYSDSDFPDNNWELILVTVGNGGSVSATQVASGGIPGSYRRVTNNVNAAPPRSEIWGFHRNVSSTYDPAVSGAIQSIDYSEDAIEFQGFGGGEGSSIALRQGGQIYNGPLILTPELSWTHHALTGLTAADFTPFPGSSGLPDFSSTGAPIEFGFVRLNGTGNQAYTIVGGIDNWQVAVNCAIYTSGVGETDPIGRGLSLSLASPAKLPITLSFELPEATDVRLEIFGLTGRLIQMMADGSYSQGRHSLVWDGRDGNGRSVSAGMYFVRLSSPVVVQVQRLVLLQ